MKIKFEKLNKEKWTICLRDDEDERMRYLMNKKGLRTIHHQASQEHENKLMTMSDKILLRRRALIETIIDHSRISLKLSTLLRYCLGYPEVTKLIIQKSPRKFAEIVFYYQFEISKVDQTKVSKKRY